MKLGYIAKITKMWYRDRKWANSVGKMTSIDFKSRIASNLQLAKKKKKKATLSASLNKEKGKN